MNPLGSINGFPAVANTLQQKLPVRVHQTAEPAGEAAPALPEQSSQSSSQASEPAPREGEVSDSRRLDLAEQIELARLKQIDTRVRAHELAHLAVAGPYARGGATFTYQRGPDGKRYAVGGEVPIDTGKEATPEATIAKMRQVQAAALAPVDPSPQDRRVAAQAALALAQARMEQRMIALEGARREAAREGGDGKVSVARGGSVDIVV